MMSTFLLVFVDTKHGNPYLMEKLISLTLNKRKHFYFRYMGICLCICLCSTCVLCPLWPEEGIRSPGKGVTDLSEPLLGFSGRAANTSNH